MAVTYNPVMAVAFPIYCIPHLELCRTRPLHLRRVLFQTALIQKGGGFRPCETLATITQQCVNGANSCPGNGER